MNGFLLYSWSGILAVILFGAVLAALSVIYLSGRKPHWRPGRRTIVAALFAPLLMILTAGIALIFSLNGGVNDDLVIASVATLTLIGGALALLAGLAAAALADRALRK